MLCSILLSILGVHDVGTKATASIEGISKDDTMLLNCLERVSYARVLSWIIVLS
jgi:hypothetical protein